MEPGATGHVLGLGGEGGDLEGALNVGALDAKLAGGVVDA